MNETFDKKRLLELSAKSCDESLSSAEFVELESILLANAEAREVFRDYTNVHVTLANCYGAAAVAESPGKEIVDEIVEFEVTKDLVVRDWPTKAMIGAAAALVLGMGAYFVLTQNQSGSAEEIVEAPPEATNTTTPAEPEVVVRGSVRERKATRQVPPQPGLIAEVISIAGGAEWAEGSVVPKAEGWLGASTLKLEKGYVRVRFASGASTTLRGPVEFELVADNLGASRARGAGGPRAGKCGGIHRAN